MRQCAVFDLDKTLINATSLLEFYPIYLKYMNPLSSEAKSKLFKNEIEMKFKQELNRANLNRWYYSEYLYQASIHDLRESGIKWFNQKLSEQNFFIDEVVSRLNYHRSQEHHTVVLTGSFREIVLPICQHLGIDSYICAPLLESQGRYTGKLYNSPTIGIGKQEALKAYCAIHNFSLEHSFGYGDDVSDIPFLELLGFPHLICHSDSDAYDLARERGWNMLAV